MMLVCNRKTINTLTRCPNTCDRGAGGSRSVNTDMSGGYVTIPSSDPDINTNTVAMSVSPDR